ncbi:hypothetical protein V6N12_030732 [Hibiscus sabdariffa]|uniref:Uncharacterized protein n=1 Tax=Hibiscus sabdariffa TaxID=183260 RepID=A0ABR2E6U3_9ROSI
MELSCFMHDHGIMLVIRKPQATRQIDRVCDLVATLSKVFSKNHDSWSLDPETGDFRPDQMLVCFATKSLTPDPVFSKQSDPKQQLVKQTRQGRRRQHEMMMGPFISLHY